MTREAFRKTKAHVFVPGQQVSAVGDPEMCEKTSLTSSLLESLQSKHPEKPILQYGNRSPKKRVDINRCTAADLVALGLHLKLAHDIIATREAKGGYESFKELSQVKGFDSAAATALVRMTMTSSKGGGKLCGFPAAKWSVRSPAVSAPSRRKTLAPSFYIDGIDVKRNMKRAVNKNETKADVVAEVDVRRKDRLLTPNSRARKRRISAPTGFPTRACTPRRNYATANKSNSTKKSSNPDGGKVSCTSPAAGVVNLRTKPVSPSPAKQNLNASRRTPKVAARSPRTRIKTTPRKAATKSCRMQDALYVPVEISTRSNSQHPTKITFEIKSVDNRQVSVETQTSALRLEKLPAEKSDSVCIQAACAYGERDSNSQKAPQARKSSSLEALMEKFWYRNAPKERSSEETRQETSSVEKAVRATVGEVFDHCTTPLKEDAPKHNVVPENSNPMNDGPLTRDKVDQHTQSAKMADRNISEDVSSWLKGVVPPSDQEEVGPDDQDAKVRSTRSDGKKVKSESVDIKKDGGIKSTKEDDIRLQNEKRNEKQNRKVPDDDARKRHKKDENIRVHDARKRHKKGDDIRVRSEDHNEKHDRKVADDDARKRHRSGSRRVQDSRREHKTTSDQRKDKPDTSQKKLKSESPQKTKKKSKHAKQQGFLESCVVM